MLRGQFGSVGHLVFALVQVLGGYLGGSNRPFVGDPDMAMLSVSVGEVAQYVG
jgi:hypothetical protein